MRTTWRVHLALLTVNIIYGLNYNIAKLAMPAYIGAYGFVLIRVLSGSALFVLLWLTVREKIKWADVPLLALCGLTGIAANQLLFFKGLSLTSPINASLIMITSPIMVLVFSAFIIKGSFTRLKLAGVFCGATGAAIIILARNDGSAHHSSLLGDLYILINAISFSVYLVAVKPLMAKYDSYTVIMWVFLLGTIMVIPFGFEQLLAVQWATIPAIVWGSITFVVIGTTFLAYGLNNYALSKVDPSIVGIYIYLQPILAGLIAVFLKGELFTPIKALAAILTCLGVYLVSVKATAFKAR